MYPEPTQRAILGILEKPACIWTNNSGNNRRSLRAVQNITRSTGLIKTTYVRLTLVGHSSKKWGIHLQYENIFIANLLWINMIL